jgi:putative membrane protein
VITRFAARDRTIMAGCRGGTVRIAADVLIALVALIHCYILVLEMFLWRTPRARAAFGTTEAFAEQSAALAANQGLYNGFLAAGLIWSLIAGGSLGHDVAIFFLSCVIVAGCYGAVTASRRILFVQVLPAAVALVVTLVAG